MKYKMTPNVANSYNKRIFMSTKTQIPIFSIIIPYYNTKKEYILQCLDSIASQSFTNFEVIVINNSTQKIYSDNISHFKSFDKFRIYDKIDQGVSCSRNYGLSLARGNYVLFVDADDWLPDNALELFFKIINTHNTPQVIIGSCYIHQQNDSFKNICKCNEGFILYKQHLLDSIFINHKNVFTCVDTPWAKAFLREFLLQNNIYFNTKLTNGEDGVFDYEVYNRASSIYFTTSIVYHYRYNPYSVCASFCPNLDKKFAVLFDEYQSKILTLGSKKDMENLYFYCIRNICRLLKKYYTKHQSYETFKQDFKHLLKMPQYKTALKKIKFNNLDNGKKIILLLCRLRMYKILYRMTKQGISIK